MKVRDRLRRWHIWLGWIVGVPLLLWTGTGLFMASFPIEQVRGEHLIAAAPPLQLAFSPVPPALGPRPLESLTLEPRPGGARWILRYRDGGASTADPATGVLLPPLGAADARAIVTARYKGSARISTVERTSAKSPTLDLRREVPAWRVTFDDGTRIYVHAQSGEILARRTSLWRLYDFMWGLHILDLGGREDTDNPWLFGLALLSFGALLIALPLLPLARRRRRRATPIERP